MKYGLLLLLLLTSSNTFGQKEFCHPKKIERVAKKLIRKLSKEDYQTVMRVNKDSAVDHQLFMAHKRNKRELKPIKKYLKSQGVNFFQKDNLEKIIMEYTYYRMHKVDTCMSELLQPYINRHLKRIEIFKKNIKADSINGIYIPINLEECFIQINTFWTDSLKTEIKNMSEKDFIVKTHFGFGRWIRNNWGLWGGSRLRTYFYELEIHHPDDMSGIILKSYHRYLNGKEIKLDEQIKYYQNYWKEVKDREKKNNRWWKFWKKRH